MFLLVHRVFFQRNQNNAVSWKTLPALPSVAGCSFKDQTRESKMVLFLHCSNPQKLRLSFKKLKHSLWCSRMSIMNLLFLECLLIPILNTP